MIIPIQPYTIGSPASPKIGTQFEVRHVTYTAPTAVADCHLLDDNGLEILSVGLVSASEAQCNAWVDDEDFFGVLAVNAGFELDTP